MNMNISLPYRLDLGKKQFYINLNQYRNAHYYTLNSAKIMFKELITDQVRELPALNAVELHYEVFIPQNREVDTNNVASIADKFFCDALVELGKIPDDNYKHVVSTTFTFGGVDKMNPRIEVSIKETQPMRRSLRLTLEDDDLHVAISDYLYKYNHINEDEIFDIVTVIPDVDIMVEQVVMNDSDADSNAEPTPVAVKKEEKEAGPLPSLLGSKPEPVKPLKLNISTGKERKEVESTESTKPEVSQDAATDTVATGQGRGPGGDTSGAVQDPTQEGTEANPVGGAAATADAPVAAVPSPVTNVASTIGVTKGSIFGTKKKVDPVPEPEAAAEESPEPQATQAEVKPKTSLFSFKKTSEE